MPPLLWGDGCASSGSEPAVKYKGEWYLLCAGELAEKFCPDAERHFRHGFVRIALDFILSDRSIFKVVGLDEA